MTKPLFIKVPLIAKGIYQRRLTLIPLFWVSTFLKNKGIRGRLLCITSATKGTLENKVLIFKQLQLLK